MGRRRVCSWVAAAAGLGLWGWGVPACLGQVAPPRPGQPVQRVQNRPRGVPNRPNVDPTARGDDELSLDGVFLPPDRGAKRRLELAEQMLEENRYGEAVRLLGSLLENPEDYFFKPDPEHPVFRSLKAEAGRLISTMPGEGRDSYELQFGARARQMLKQAAASGNLADLAEISRRFFYTQAGQAATFLLGRHNLDQNRPLAAALCFERLRENPAVSRPLEPVLSLTLATCWLRASKPEKAKDVLIQLKRSYPKAEILLAGKPVKLFASDSQAVAWMQAELGAERPGHQVETEAWTLFRGDESRNAPSPGGRPLLNPRWRQRTTEDRAVERFVGKVRQDYLNQDIVALPSLHPLAVGDVVLMRTAFALQAVDFQHGKLVWKYASTDDALEQFLNAGTSQPTGQTALLLSGLDQRMWDDAIYGTISSDGAQVYYVEDLGLAGVTASPLKTFMPNGQQRFSANSRGTNRLAARDLRTQGKLKWEVGGLSGEDEPKLAGAFFLGPPLPLLGHLYALADMKGQEIRLVVLSAKNGALEWSQQLAVVEPNMTQDGFRRNAGATPSFADGVLVCPTSAGAIVGIDLTTRSLLWGYQYPRLQQGGVDRFNAVRFGIYPGSERRANEHWADACVTIADSRALVNPVESDQLYCLNLVDGKELWKQNRDNHLYVGCVHRGKVILIGHNTVSALKLADGDKAWPDIELPSGSMPSGRGFYTGDAYYLPMTSAEVAKINLQTGRMEERARSRGGNIPGNLICYRGSIISQGVDYLDAYFQLDALKQQVAKTLEDHPDDPKSLAALGEVKLDQGALGEAIELFRRSYSLKNDDTTREQLVESLLEGLRVDFSAHRGGLAELDGLIEQKQHRLTYLRLMALGLQKSGEISPAFEAYLQLADTEASAGLDAIDPSLSVRRDRWIRVQLEQLRAAASPDQQRQIDAALAARLKSVLEAESIDALRTFIAIFGGHPAAEQARDALVSKLGVNDLIEREMLLRHLERSASEADVAGAVARLAQMMREAGRTELAAIYYRQLAERFAQVVCRDGKTGQQLVAALPAESPIRDLLQRKIVWPSGKMVSKEDRAATRNTPQPRLPRAVDLEIVGPTGPFFDDTTVSLDLQGPVLVGQDGLGEKRFRILLNEQGRRPIPANNRYNGYNAPALSYAGVNGSLLVLSMGNQVLAVDTLSGAESSSNRVLWTQDLNDQIAGLPTNQGIHSQPVPVLWGGTRNVPTDPYSRRLGTIGPVNEDGIYFQRLRDLYCVDPLTGKTLWMRKNVGLGNDLFGDQELLFVAPPGEGDTIVLRAATGEMLGTRRIASFDKRMTTIGRLVLSWEPQGAEQVMQMRDAWEGRTLWSYTFAPGTKADLVSQEAVGVFEPNGDFSLVTLADGKLLAKERLEPENTLVGVYLLRSRDQYLLVTQTPARNEPGTTIAPLPAAPNSPLINGRVYAFERSTGKKMWPAPAVISQQGLLLSQPSEVPVLVFVRQVHRPGPPNAREPKTSVLCLDKRTGRVVYENEQLQGTTIGSFELSGDPKAHTVSLSVASKLITLSFTNDPVDP